MGYDTSPASVHDSKRGAELIDNNDIKGEEFWLDAGYVGTDDGFISRGITPIICEKGFRGHPLNDEQKRNNRTKSKIRCRVEHVFGFIERSIKLTDFSYLTQGSISVMKSNLVLQVGIQQTTTFYFAI